MYFICIKYTYVLLFYFTAWEEETYNSMFILNLSYNSNLSQPDLIEWNNQNSKRRFALNKTGSDACKGLNQKSIAKAKNVNWLQARSKPIGFNHTG